MCYSSLTHADPPKQRSISKIRKPPKCRYRKASFQNYLEREKWECERVMASLTKEGLYWGALRGEKMMNWMNMKDQDAVDTTKN
jgi:hypothetical protein